MASAPAAGPSSRTPRLDQRRNGEQILQAAAALLAVDPGTSMQAVADAAGLTRLTVYRHFASRSELEASLLAAIDARAAEILDGLPGWDQGQTTLRVLVGALADLVRRYPVVAVRHRVETGQRRSAVDGRLSEVLREGQRAGVLRDDLPPDVVNGTIFAVLATHAQLRPRASAAELAEGVCDLLLQGLGAWQLPG